MADHPGADAIGRAIGASPLGALPPATRGRLAAGAILIDLPAGTTFYREAEAARFAIVAAGLVRVYLTAPDGRQVTVRYARPGDLLGAPTAVGGPVDVGAQALTVTALAMLDVGALRRLAQADVEVAWAIAEEVSRRLRGVLEAFAGNAFGSVRQRVARHLLDLAAAGPAGGPLVAAVTQQALADAVGTSREVAARTLHDLREAGLVATGRAGIAIADPLGLGDVAEAGEL